MDMRTVARDYLKQGFSVIPVLPEAKKPALASWMKYNDTKANNIDLQSWFVGKDTNIGIVTGKISKIVVIDIDKPELYDSFIQQYPTHRIQRTPSGGYHLLYHYEGDDIGNSVSKLSNGIDVRGRHGFIVTAPSTIRLSNGTLGEYRWEKDGEALPLPSDLHDTIVSEINRQTSGYKIELAGSKGDSDAKNLYIQVMTTGFTPGQHNEQTKDIARLLFRMGLAVDLIHSTLDILNNKDDTPLTKNELIATVNSGIKYERDRLEASKVEDHSFNVIDFATMQAKYKDYKREWLIEDWLMKGSLIVVTAPPENYKTWIALEAVIQVALGSNSKSFLNGGWQGPEKGLPTLIVQQEDNMGLIMERVSVIMNEKIIDKNGPQPEIYFHTDGMLALDDEASIAGLEKAIKDHNIALVMIDPVYSLASSDDFFASMARKLSVIKRMRDTYGTTFLFVHHNKKGTGGLKKVEDLAREGMFGSQLLNGAFEGMWMINRMDDANKTRIIGRTGKSFSGGQKVWGIDFQIETPEVYVQGQEYPETELHYKVRLQLVGEETLTDEQTKMRDALREMVEGTRSAVIEAAGFDRNSRKYKKAFDELVAMGAAVDSGKKRSGGPIYEFVLSY